MPHEEQSQQQVEEEEPADSNKKASVEKSCDDEDAVFVDAEPYDILLGRGRGHVRHPGNIRFHGEVLRLLPRYEAATTYSEKMSLTRQVVEYVQKMGRFLKKNTSKTRWMEIDDETARFCVSQAFRNHRRETVNADQPKQRQDPATATAVKETSKEATGTLRGPIAPLRLDDDHDPQEDRTNSTTTTGVSFCDSARVRVGGCEAIASPKPSSPSLEETESPGAASKLDPRQPPPAPISMTPTAADEVISHEMRDCRQTPPSPPPPSPHPPRPPPPQEETMRQPPPASLPALYPEALWYGWPPHPPLPHPLPRPPPPRVIMGPPSYAPVPSYPVIPQQFLSGAPPPWAMRPQGEMALRRWRGLLDNPWLFTEEDLFHALLRRRRGRQTQQQHQHEPDQQLPAASRELQLPERISPQRLPPRKRAKLEE